jgi:hypothetical protein
MRKLILTVIAGLMLAGLMLAASATAGPTAASGAKLVVVMHDPGCHWFYLGGGPDHRRYATTVTRRGPVTLVNLDEAALKIKGPGGTKTERVGAKLTLKAKGLYRITMVGQAPDDKVLKLAIK